MNILKNISKPILFGLLVGAVGTPVLQGFPALSPELITAEADNQASVNYNQNDALFNLLETKLIVAQLQGMLLATSNNEVVKSLLTAQKLMLLTQICLKQNKMREILVPFFLQSSADEQAQYADPITKIVFNDIDLGMGIVVGDNDEGTDSFINYGYMNNVNLASVLNNQELIAELEGVPQFTETKNIILAKLNMLNSLPKLHTLHGHLPLQMINEATGFFNLFGSKMLTTLSEQAPVLAEKFQQLKNETEALTQAGQIDTSI